MFIINMLPRPKNVMIARARNVQTDVRAFYLVCNSLRNPEVDIMMPKAIAEYACGLYLYRVLSSDFKIVR